MTFRVLFLDFFMIFIIVKVFPCLALPTGTIARRQPQRLPMDRNQGRRKEAVDARKMAKIGPKQAQDDPRQAQDGSKPAQDRPKTGPRWPKTGPR